MTPKNFPALFTQGLNAVLAIFVAAGVFNTNLSHAVEVVATALASLICACLVRPVAVPTIVGLVSTILVGISGFGLHLSSPLIAAITTALALFAGWFTHASVTPTHAVRRRTTVYRDLGVPL